MSDTNVGFGMVPHRKGCRCEECEFDRLECENAALRRQLADAQEKVERLTSTGIEELKWQLAEARKDLMRNEEKVVAKQKRLNELHAQLAGAETLCKIYFDIAANAIGEDLVREKRDAAIAETEPQSSPDEVQR